MPIYTQAQLESDVNAKIKGKKGILIDIQSVLNQGVRQAFGDIDFLSSRRRTQLNPNLISGVFEYEAPTDLKGYGIITIQNQTFDRTRFWSLVPYEQFRRRLDHTTIAISDYDFYKKIFVQAYVGNSSHSSILSSLDTTVAGGGTWVGFGDGTNLETDENNFVQGTGSVRFDIDGAGGTTAGIQNTTLTSFDITNYIEQNGFITVWTYIADTTNITNFILRVGSSNGDYYTRTVTSQFDNTAFVNGWNLLKFNLQSISSVGTPDPVNTSFCAVYMTKATGKINETGYRFDDISLKRGEVNNLYYYSNYGWQSSAGVYKKDSTTASDLLNCDSDEYEIVLAKCAEIAAGEVDENTVEEKMANRYLTLKRAYLMEHPSEALIMISTVADFVKV